MNHFTLSSRNKLLFILGKAICKIKIGYFKIKVSLPKISFTIIKTKIGEFKEIGSFGPIFQKMGHFYGVLQKQGNTQGQDACSLCTRTLTMSVQVLRFFFIVQVNTLPADACSCQTRVCKMRVRVDGELLTSRVRVNYWQRIQSYGSYSE